MSQKLTNEKARELLKELQYAKAQMGGQLSIRDEYFKQALERLPRWIACSERLPSRGDEVLALYNGGHMNVLFINRDGKFWDDGDFNSAIKFGDITHWMPLPETPL